MVAFFSPAVEILPPSLLFQNKTLASPPTKKHSVHFSEDTIFIPKNPLPKEARIAKEEAQKALKEEWPNFLHNRKFLLAIEKFTKAISKIEELSAQSRTEEILDLLAKLYTKRASAYSAQCGLELGAAVKEEEEAKTKKREPNQVFLIQKKEADILYLTKAIADRAKAATTLTPYLT
jgi:hypothetical protein